MSKITSLEHVRRKKAAAVRREGKPAEERIEELEVDVEKLIDVVMDLEDRLFRQEGYLRRLVRLLRRAKTDE